MNPGITTFLVGCREGKIAGSDGGGVFAQLVDGWQQQQEKTSFRRRRRLLERLLRKLIPPP